MILFYCKKLYLGNNNVVIIFSTLNSFLTNLKKALRTSLDALLLVKVHNIQDITLPSMHLYFRQVKKIIFKHQCF